MFAIAFIHVIKKFKKMNTGTLIIGAIMIAICVLPIVLIYRSRKNTEKKLIQSLNNLAEKQHCKVSNLETWSNSAIGIDETTNMLFFYRQIKEKEIARNIKLSEISKCMVHNTNRNIKEGNYSITEKIELVLSPKTKGNPDIALEFYDAEISAQLSGEPQLAEKWARNISGRLVKKV